MKWIDHPLYRRDEQFMLVLNDCGMATFEQLLTITGWSKRTVKQQIEKLYERSRNHPDEEWLVTHRLSRPHRNSKVVYALGKQGMYYVHATKQEGGKVRETPFGQAMHFVGINEILVRCLEKEGREDVSWLSSYEVTDLIVLDWEQQEKKLGELDRRNFIRPDAELTIKNQSFYIEYDHDTEGPRKLARKFRNYVYTMIPIQDPTPIVWVAPNDKRRDYLEKNWEALKQIWFADEKTPEMYFFTEGEETDWLIFHAS